MRAAVLERVFVQHYADCSCTVDTRGAKAKAAGAVADDVDAVAAATDSASIFTLIIKKSTLKRGQTLAVSGLSSKDPKTRPHKK